MKTAIARKSHALFYLTCTFVFAAACSGRGNVDLSKATPLTAEPVKTPPKGSDASQMNPLFSYAPGTWVSMKAVGGVIDPVGTSLELDFDGDGIDNTKEKTSNIWVADYPVIDTQIAPPVTMNIEILKTTNGELSTINTNLTSDNFESKKNEGSEEFHQNETTVKTINNGSTTSGSSNTIGSSSTKTSKQSTSIGISLGPVSINDAPSAGITNTGFSSETKFNTTTTQLYEDRPFKNNIDRNALSVRSEDAARQARDYRAEKRLRQVDNFVTKSDGGIVRAALYIKNHSVNMPVKLSNILCSLVFETPRGALIPVQSFRLRNDDYSLFAVEVYGNSEFGPYVVTLSGLNTAEIENAIQLGYTPKIYIVDYTMTHVQDSGYRLSLGSNFSGDNLKIIEENAKGRTALLKLMYPNYREMFRITAFDTKFVLGGSDICNPAHIDTASNTSVSPGIAMHKFLERLKCSGVDVKFDHYVFDFTGMPQAGIYPQFYVFAVKSVNSKAVTAPCTSMMPGIGYNPATGDYDLTINACVIKIADLTEEQLDSFGVWGISNNGKYYTPGDFARDGNDDIRTFNGVPILKGVSATVWAGDNYDLVQLRLSDIMAGLNDFGKNPLETGNAMPFNTKWDLSQLGNNPFDPEVKSIYLGKVGLGETIELTFNLKDTTFLNPDFGPAMHASSKLAFSQFSYNMQKASQKFNLTEAIDFELSMGMGGAVGDWQNILRPPIGANNIALGPVAVDYLNQKFTVLVKLPDSHPLATASGTVNLFLRPALSNAYRNSIWPQAYAKVKKYDATLNAAIPTGSTVIPVKTGIGSITDIATGTDLLKIVTDGVVYSYPITAGAISTAVYGYDVSITSTVSAAHKAGDRVYVDAGLNQPQVTFFMDYTDTSNNFLKAWNHYCSVGFRGNPGSQSSGSEIARICGHGWLSARSNRRRNWRRKFRKPGVVFLALAYICQSKR